MFSGRQEQGFVGIILVRLVHHCRDGVIIELSQYHNRFLEVRDDHALAVKYAFDKAVDERRSEKD